MKPLKLLSLSVVLPMMKEVLDKYQGSPADTVGRQTVVLEGKTTTAVNCEMSWVRWWWLGTQVQYCYVWLMHGRVEELLAHRLKAVARLVAH